MKGYKMASGALLGASWAPPPLPPTWADVGVRALALELRSREFRGSEGRSKRASAAGSAGPRPDLSPSGCGPRPFADSVSKNRTRTPEIYLKSIKNISKMDLGDN